MRAWVTKEKLSWFEDMRCEGRTREIEISTFPRYEDDREVEVEIKELDGEKEEKNERKKRRMRTCREGNHWFVKVRDCEHKHCNKCGVCQCKNSFCFDRIFEKEVKG